MVGWRNTQRRGMPCCVKQKSLKNGIAMECGRFSVLHVRKVFCNAPCSVIIHHLFLFNAIKIVLYQ